jgi:hypothetical protein
MQPQGPCSEPLTEALVADFTGSGVTVVDRLHLKALMAEHKLNVGGMIDGKTAAKIGRLIGTGSLVFVRVYECKTYHAQESSISPNGQRAMVPTTRGLLRGSVQIIIMTTGVTIVAPALDAKVALQSGDGNSDPSSAARRRRWPSGATTGKSIRSRPTRTRRAGFSIRWSTRSTKCCSRGRSGRRSRFTTTRNARSTSRTS